MKVIGDRARIVEDLHAEVDDAPSGTVGIGVHMPPEVVLLLNHDHGLARVVQLDGRVRAGRAAADYADVARDDVLGSEATVGNTLRVAVGARERNDDGKYESENDGDDIDTALHCQITHESRAEAGRGGSGQRVYVHPSHAQRLDGQRRVGFGSIYGQSGTRRGPR